MVKRSMSMVKSFIYTACRPLRRLRGTHAPQIEYIPVSIPALPAAFEGYTLAVVTDMHLPDSLSTPQEVLSSIDRIQPDIILLAGDIANRHSRFVPEETAVFLKNLAQKAPAFAVTGNHEQTADYLPVFRTLAAQAGVTLLENTVYALQKEGQVLPLYGLCTEDITPVSAESPSILLCHFPHTAAGLAESGFSLAVCGHAHGGQIRFGKQGLYAPGQGFFPRYTSGLYRVGSMQMVVSRGGPVPPVLPGCGTGRRRATWGSVRR